MQVHCDEGVAIRIDPESCVDDPRGRGEALTGARTGQPSSRERRNPGCRRRLGHGRQHGQARYASAWTIRRGRRPWHVRTLFVREAGDLTLGRLDSISRLPVRIGKARSRSR